MELHTVTGGQESRRARLEGKSVNNEMEKHDIASSLTNSDRDMVNDGNHLRK